MTRTTKVSFILSAILGIALGGKLGYSQGAELGESMRSLEPIAAGFVISDFAARQFHYADIEHARQAALLEISIREQLRTASHESAVDGELGLAYVRLAMVEEAAGNKEAKRQALKQAKVCFPPPGPGRELGDDQLKEALNRMNEYGRSAPSGP